MARLIVQEGAGIGSHCAIAPKTVIGRLQSCALTLTEEKSSRQHVEIEKIGPSYLAKDLGSRNGTTLNDAPLVEPMLLSNGDIIGIGATRIAFFLDSCDLKPGDTIGNFTIRSDPRPSDCGWLYTALQKGLEREVTLEILAPDLAADPDLTERFLARARRVSGFNNPKILRAFELGTEALLNFTAWEKFDGRSLRRLTQTTPLGPRSAMLVLVQVAEALRDVHFEGGCHGRLNPSTVLVDDEGSVKLVGFGLDPRGPVTGSALPNAAWQAAFCAPEIGRGLDPEPPADVYALGALGYCLLSGAPPYSGKTAVEVLRQAADPEPVPALGDKVELPAEITALIDDLLSKSVAERPEARTARDRLEAAFRLLDGEEDDEDEASGSPKAGPRASASRRRSTSSSARRKGASASARRKAQSSSSARKKAAPSASARLRQSGSSERKRLSSSSERRRAAGVDQARGPRHEDEPESWGRNILVLAMLYLGAFLATRILLALLAKV